MNKRNGATFKGNKPEYDAPIKRTQGRKIKEVDVAAGIKTTFDELNAELKKEGYELIIRRPLSKDLVMFDYGLLFTKDSKEVQVYVDDDLREVIEHLLETNAQVLIKSNWLSPDTIAITVPDNNGSRMTQDVPQDTLIDNNVEVVSE